MHGTESVANLMSNYLPFIRCYCHHIGTTDNFPSSSHHVRDTELPEPGQANFGSGGTTRKERPEGIAIAPFTAPRREHVQAVSDGSGPSASSVPRSIRGRGCWAVPSADSQILQTKCDAERSFVEAGSRLKLLDYVLPDFIFRIERGRIATVRGNADQSDPSCRRASF